jgi:hypothetical protein
MESSGALLALSAAVVRTGFSDENEARYLFDNGLAPSSFYENSGNSRSATSAAAAWGAFHCWPAASNGGTSERKRLSSIFAARLPSNSARVTRCPLFGDVVARDHVSASTSALTTSFQSASRGCPATGSDGTRAAASWACLRT